MKVVKFAAVVLASGILLAGFSTVTLAEEQEPRSVVLSENNKVDLEKIVVTPYRATISAKENPSATNVINVGEEESVGKLSFVDAVKGSQGIDYAVTGGMEGVSSIYIRGADAYHTQLMLDGIKIYDPINTQGYFAYYN
ncbi:MAG: TonB-dependent receptor plug domain-containing protein [Candidatus Omnitrophica bacterium]|nr:TonB-dependent receptor plug domain-containing protein [Candidatus Omnitrophota bacterium]